LPPERFGEAIPDAGGTSHGLFSRSLRSRELAWLVAALLVGSAAAGFGPGSGAARAVFAVVASFAVLALLDPVFRARVRTSRTLRAWHRRSNVALATSADAAHRMVGSPVGIALVLLGVGWAWRLWHGTDLAGHALFHVVVLGVMLAAVLEALSLLSLHWRVGDEGDRRAIAWVLLGSFGSLVAWLLVVAVAGAYAAMRWDEPAGAASGAKRALGTVLTVGPFVVALLAIVATAVSALARGSFDAAMALRRGTVYGLLGVVLTGLFVAVEGLASSIVVVRVGMPSETGAFIAGTATALAFGPLRSRVEARVRALLDRMLPAMSLADAERRTCVVAFCDLVGYTSLAASDEPESLRQAALLHEAARRTVAGERGRVVKTLGDAVMLGFEEPRAALAGIAALWRAYREGAGAAGLDPLPLHASAHAGEVAVARDGDLFGANVNLAARLLGIAGADELALTGELREVVKASGWPHRECEPVALRNVPEPVPILRILLRDVQGARA
jgi:class 3 adenylate cyclase